MTEVVNNYSIEELVPIIRMANILTLNLTAERHNDLPITGAKLDASIANAIYENTINFKIDYELLLHNSQPEKESDVVGSLAASLLVTYEVANPPRPGWEEGAPLLSSMAALAGHPYLRQIISSMAGNLSFPNVTLGLVRYGSTIPESVTVGDRVYSFSQEGTSIQEGSSPNS